MDSSVTPSASLVTRGSSLHAAARRRRDVKAEDREKSMSPLDKDALKQRCLERLRSERRRHLARNRAQHSSNVLDLTASTTVEMGTSEEDGTDQSLFSLSTPREILRHGLKDMSENRRLGTRTRRSLHRTSGTGGTEASLRQSGSSVQRKSLDVEIPEEGAYVDTCTDARLKELDSAGNPGQQSDRSVLQEAMALEGEDGYIEDDEDWDNHHLLSREEYEEMMRYIEEACREEDMRAEAEMLEEYELNKRLEDEALQSAVSAGLHLEDSHQGQPVLCPLCKRDYLVQAGSPSRAAVVCVCGFRLDLREDCMSLEHLRQQLAETYEQHCSDFLRPVVKQGSDPVSRRPTRRRAVPRSAQVWPV